MKKHIYAALFGAALILNGISALAESERYVVVLKEAPLVNLFNEDDGVINYVDNIFIVDSMKAAYSLAPSGNVEAIFPDEVAYLFDNAPATEAYPTGANDEYYADQWYLPYINASTAWRRGFTGSNVRIGIIDSGMDLKHPDLPQPTYYYNAVAGYDNLDIQDELGHGTAVTGIVAAHTDNSAYTSGITPDAELVSIKVATATTMSTGDLLLGLKKAISYDCDVINMSLGFTQASAPATYAQMESIVSEAIADGVIIVAAAGNDGADAVIGSDYQYPASYDNVVSVGSIGAYTTSHLSVDVDFESVELASRQTDGSYKYVSIYADAPSSFTQHNDKITCAAPGYQIMSTGLDRTVGRKSGTSFSSPVVAAAAVVAKQINPNITAPEFISVLQSSCDDIFVKGYDNYTGYGKLNLDSMITKLAGVEVTPTPSPTPEPAAYGTCGDGLTWVLDNAGTLTISSTGAMKDWSSRTAVPWYSYRTNIKKAVIESGVTSIGNNAFYSCSVLSSVEIANSVTRIGKYAFRDCDLMSAVALPDSITAIDEAAFYDCDLLTSIKIPDGITSISKNTFHSCDLLTTVTLPDTVTGIGERAFYSCPLLKNITLPGGLTAIDTYAFYGCSALKSVTVPGNIVAIGNNAFESCSALTSVTIDNGVVSLGESTFKNCSSLTGVAIPDSVVSIDDSAFYGCSALTDIPLPDTLLAINAQAFYNCTSLKSITLPDNMISIGDRAFYGCDSLTDITIPGGIIVLGARAFYNCDSLSDVTLNEGLTSIDTYTFYNCPSLKRIVIPGSVTNIGNYAFRLCSSLTEAVILYDNVSFGSDVFKSCADGFTIKGYADSTAQTYAANNSHNFAIWDPSATPEPTAEPTPEPTETPKPTVTPEFTAEPTPSPEPTADPTPDPTATPEPEIDSGAIGEASYTYESGTLTISGNGIADTADTAPWADHLRDITEIIVTDGVTGLGDNIFSGCINVTDISLPQSLEKIGENAFKDCKSLTALTIPKTVTSISANCLAGCEELEILKIPFTGETVNDTDNVFAFIFGSSAADIPESLKEVYITRDQYIAANDFAEAVNIEKIVIESEKESWNERVTEVVDIGRSAFAGCSSLKSLTIKSERLTSIGAEICNGANSLEFISVPFVGDTKDSNNKPTSTFGYFFGSADEQVVGKTVSQSFNINENKYYYIPNTIRQIEITSEDGIPYGAFMNMYSVETIDIYTSATIDPYAFYNCSGLIYAVLPTDLKSLGERAFANCGYLEAVRMPDNENQLEMGSHVFYNCYNLQRAIIPGNVSAIASDAFSGCANLTIYGYDDTYAQEYATENRIDFISLDAAYTNDDLDKIMRGEMPDGTISISCERYTSSVAVELSAARIGVITAAVYDKNGRLTGVSSVPTNDSTTTYGVPAPEGTVKVMLWNSTEDMVPLAQAWTK